MKVLDGIGSTFLPLVPIELEAGWAPELVWALWWR